MFKTGLAANRRSAVVLIAASSASCAIALGCTATASAHANAVHVSARSAGSQLTIAGNEGLTSDPFWISASCGGTRAAQANGAKMIWKGFTTNSTSADSTNVQDIQLLHPDGVIMSSPTSLTFATERKQWMSTGTPVAEINTVTADPNFYKAYTAAPTASSDLAFAKVIVKDIGKSGSFAILGGQAGIPFLEAVWKPVVATLHKIDPGVTVLPTQYDNFSTSTSATVVSGLITAHPDLKGIYSISGPEGTGVITALRQAGKLGKIDAFSGSGDPDLVSDLKAGDITALLAQSPYLMGYDAVKSLIGYLKAHQGAKGAVPHAKPQAVALSTFIVTHANVNSKSAKNYEYLTACKK